jgi:hypothetical protein
MHASGARICVGIVPSYYGGVKVVRSFYGAGVEAFMGLGELYIRSADEFASCIVGVDISTEGWPVFRWSTIGQ